MAAIALDRLEKVFPNGHAALRGVSLDVADGELVVLVGPSGSGKTTALRLIAGFETPTAGRVLIGGREVTALPPQARDLAMVFQSYALYPHKSVRENLAFGLRVRRLDPRVIDERVTRAAGALQIADLLDRRPAQLSGGQRQRVALGRAIVREPQAFLFDEPLSNLDPGLRVDTRAEIARLHRRLGATMVYVTHDQEEAMTLGRRIVVMRDGRVEQIGAPLDVYRRPATTFVARFIGSPPMNLLTGPMAPLGIDAATIAGIRPQDVEMGAPAGADLAGAVDLVEPLGAELRVHLRLREPDGTSIVATTTPDAAVALGDIVGLRFRRDRLHLFDAATGIRAT